MGSSCYEAAELGDTVEESDMGNRIRLLYMSAVCWLWANTHSCMCCTL